MLLSLSLLNLKFKILISGIGLLLSIIEKNLKKSLNVCDCMFKKLK